MKNLIFIGLFFLFLGFILIFVGSFLNTKESNVKYAGGIFIGPIPIFGTFSDKKMFYLLIILGIVFFIFWLIFRNRLI